MNTPNSPVASLHRATLALGGRTLWRQLDFAVQPGECIAVLGPNGSGKSSLVKALLGLQPLDAGEARLLGGAPAKARNRIGYIPQQKTFDRDVPLTGRDLVGLGLTGSRLFAQFTRPSEHTAIAQAIRRVGATRYADKPVGRLSGGEQQRLRIAQAIVDNPALLLCDEPLLSLDLASQSAIASLINDQRKKGAAVLFVTHEINPILPFVDRVLYLVGGRWAVGTPTEVLTTERLSNLYGAPVEVLDVHGRIIVVASTDTAITEPHDAYHHHVVHTGDQS